MGFGRKNGKPTIIEQWEIFIYVCYILGWFFGKHDGKQDS